MIRKVTQWLEKGPGTELLRVGDRLPDLRSADQDGVEVDLRREAGTGWQLIYFFPKAETPGCTLQACDLRDAFAELEEAGVAVWGVSVDGEERARRFRERRRLPFRLLPDPERRVLRAFGVPTVFGWSRRVTFLFRDGVLRWRDDHAAPWRQAADVLRVVRSETAGGEKDAGIP